MRRHVVMAGFVLAVLLMMAGSALPAPAVGVAAEPIAGWVLASSLPDSLVAGSLPKADGLQRQAFDQVAAALGRPYRMLTVLDERPVFTRDAAGRYGFVLGIEVGAVLSGTEAEAAARAAQGKFDAVRYVRAAGQAENGAWTVTGLQVLDAPQLPVPLLPAGAQAGQGERVRGWPISINGGEAVPPIGSGLNLSDVAPLRALTEELAGYPAEVIAGSGPQDQDYVVSTELQASGAVLAGQETEALVVVRTVNIYRRAPWMDALWQGSFRMATGRLDTAARAAGVSPDRIFSQRFLVKRAGTGWEIAAMQILPGAYTLTVTPPTVADRVIGAMGTVKLHVPWELRQDPEPMDPTAAAAAAAVTTLVLGAWAGAQVMSSSSATAHLPVSVTDETTGSRVTKMFSGAVDWAFRPLERTLARAMRATGTRVGLFQHLVPEGGEPDRPRAQTPAPAAARTADAKGRPCCAVCGSPVRDAWRHCTACGSPLVSARSAAGGERS